MKSLILIFNFFSIFSYAQSTEKKRHSIDVSELKCLDKKIISNAEMCNCTKAAREAWDKALNKYYNLLKTNLPKETFELLKESQKQWIKFRDNEFSFISKFYLDDKEGTMWHVVSENAKKEIVKDRAMELEDIYGMLGY
jgi:uncharacterized protein YecT (DUF1311 family)